MANLTPIVTRRFGQPTQAHDELDIANGERLPVDAIPISPAAGNAIVNDGNGMYVAAAGEVAPGATRFTQLTDTFTSYTGRAGQAVVVNDASTGLTTVDLPSGGGGGGATVLTELDDTFVSYTGRAKQVLTVTEQETGTTTRPVSYFISTDSGNSITSGSDGGLDVRPFNPTSYISSDENNSLVLGEDGNYFVPEGSVVPGNLISTDANNALVEGEDGLLYVPEGSISPEELISEDEGNVLELGSDNKLYVIAPSLDFSDAISDDVGNNLVLGDDNKLYVGTVESMVHNNLEFFGDSDSLRFFIPKDVKRIFIDPATIQGDIDVAYSGLVVVLTKTYNMATMEAINIPVDSEVALTNQMGNHVTATILSGTWPNTVAQLSLDMILIS